MDQEREKERIWWEIKYGKNSRCAITHTRLRPGKNWRGESHAVFLKCGHGFCRSALTYWMRLNNSCPLCRQKIIFKRIIK